MNNNAQPLLSVPANAGRAIVESAAILRCGLLGTDKFVDYCRKRNISVDRSRLCRLERLGLFAPVFRVRQPLQKVQSFRIPIVDGQNWFESGHAWDTTAIPIAHSIPRDDDDTQEGYYSVFQLDWLSLVISEMEITVHLDSYLDFSNGEARCHPKPDVWLRHASELLASSRAHSFRPAIALLCQYISNYYYHRTQGDQRTIRTGTLNSWDNWTEIGWNRDYKIPDRLHGAGSAQQLFSLTPQNLKHAFQCLALSQSSVDPLEDWYELVQFISVDRRQRLKGDALRAETLRAGARMLQMLYKDLYNETLPHPNEVARTVLNPLPEVSMRSDTRRHLEFVVNRFGLNPQPKLVLIVEGASEEGFVHGLCDELFGFPLDRCAIEVVNIRGVGNVTGSRKDGSQAIIRLIDYLHHHQTLVFLVLDNENDAKLLKAASRAAISLFGQRTRATRAEYLKIWKVSFEFDNYSDSEIATGLSVVNESQAQFYSSEVKACRASPNPGAALERLYGAKCASKIPKTILATELLRIAISPVSRRRPENRPISKVLVRVLNLARSNSLPISHEMWYKNQKSKRLAKRT